MSAAGWLRRAGYSRENYPGLGSSCKVGAGREGEGENVGTAVVGAAGDAQSVSIRAATRAVNQRAMLPSVLSVEKKYS